MDEKNFHDDIYSNSFNVLKIIGLWPIYTHGNIKRLIFTAYRCFVITYGFFNLLLAFFELYLSLNDFRQISFNLSTTLFALSIFIRGLHLMRHSEDMDDLRWKLFQDRLHRQEEIDVSTKEEFRKTFLIYKKIFLFSGIFFLPVWLYSSLASLNSGPRKMPFSLWLPANLNNDNEFGIAFVYHCIVGILTTLAGIHGELISFGIMIQIALQYKILINDVNKIRDTCEKALVNSDGKLNHNKIFLERQMSDFMKKCVQKQVTLIGYLKIFENRYNRLVLFQFGCSLVLMIVNGIELLTTLSGVGLKFYYQMGYAIIIVSDAFMICYLALFIEKQKQDLSAAIFDLPWYAMNVKIQKNILLMIIGSQINQTLTAGKLFKLDINTFLMIIKTVSSCLTIFWQFMKMEEKK